MVQFNQVDCSEVNLSSIFSAYAFPTHNLKDQNQDTTNLDFFQVNILR